MSYKKILIPCFVIVLILICGSFVVIRSSKPKDKVGGVLQENSGTEMEYVATSAILKAVVVKVQADYLYVMEIGNSNSLIRLSLKDFSRDSFQMRQEILVYYNGVRLTIFPEEIRNISQIEIVKEVSDIPILDRYLRYCYNSEDSVEVSIVQITEKGIKMTIEDANELPYQYPSHYTIQKQVRNENYTGVSQTIGENTSNSTAGNMRNRV